MKRFKIFIVGMLLVSFFIPMTLQATEAKTKVDNQKTQTSEKIRKSDFKMKHSQVNVGDKWEAETNFDSATDSEGKELKWKDIHKKIKIDGEVDTSKTGSYNVTFTYNKMKQKVKVEVVAKKDIALLDLKNLHVKNQELTIGESFDPTSLFESAEKQDGTKVTWKDLEKDIKIDSQVNVNKVGVYEVIFSYGKVVATSEVTVKEKVDEIKPIKINVVNSVISLGEKWSPDLNFKSILLSNDTHLFWNDVIKEVIVTGTVDTEKPGDYPVTYQFGDLVANVNVTVKELEEIKVQEIAVKDTNLPLGNKWQPEDNFNYVQLSNGVQLNWQDVEKEIKVTSEINSEVPGEYKVVYEYKDKSAVAKVIVKEMEEIKVQEISVKDSQLNRGAKWEAKDNFNYVLMSNGTKLTWDEVAKDIKISGEVKNEVPGTYQINYALGDKVAVAKVTIKELEVIKVQEIVVKDTNLPLGEKWEAQNNFKHVLMSDGTQRNWKDVEKDIKVIGEVKVNTPGTYQVTYTYEDKSAVAKVTVKEMEVIKTQEISVKNLTIKAGNKWEAKDNFNYVMLSNGIKLNWKDVEKDIKVAGNVDTNKVGSYQVTYTYGDKSAVAKVIVEANQKTIVPVKPTKKLPQTGEVSGKGMLILGALIIIVVVTLLFRKKANHPDE